MKKNTIIWIILIALTAGSVTLTHASLQRSFLIAGILAIACAKFLGVAFQFMEIRSAHAGWKMILSLFAVTFSVLVFSFS